MRMEYIIGIVIVILIAMGLGVLFISSPRELRNDGEFDNDAEFNTEIVAEAVTDTPVATDKPTQTTAVQEKPQPQPQSQPQSKPKPKGKPYTEIVNPAGFVNTDPITIKQFVGKKVILIDFLTYSCINCQRTFPYLNAWDAKYREQGLLTIGIHTPEFAFEKSIDNVREAMKKFGITHPIVLDNDYSTWNAWGNRFWPRKYLIDIYGNVVYDHIGEGAYEETEMKIRELLDERAKVLGEQAVANQGSLASKTVVQVGSSAKSPETYFGSDRNEYLGNGKRSANGVQELVIPSTTKANMLYLGGKWDITGEYAKNKEAGAKILYNFEAKNVHFVAGADKPVAITVMLDGKKYGEHTIQANTLYTLVSNASMGEHALEIVINSSGLEAYTFTFN